MNNSKRMLNLRGLSRPYMEDHVLVYKAQFYGRRNYAVSIAMYERLIVEDNIKNTLLNPTMKNVIASFT